MAPEEELKCKLCRETVDPESAWIVRVGYGQDLHPAPSGAFCSGEHMTEWFQRGGSAADLNDNS
jgi:hypothetical protein